MKWIHTSEEVRHDCLHDLERLVELLDDSDDGVVALNVLLGRSQRPLPVELGAERVVAAERHYLLLRLVELANRDLASNSFFPMLEICRFLKIMNWELGFSLHVRS